MKKTLEKLWNEYLMDECAVISTEEERKLMKKTAELREKLEELLTNEQTNAVKEYADALCDLESHYIKKAFFKGCEFSVSFLSESRNT